MTTLALLDPAVAKKTPSSPPAPDPPPEPEPYQAPTATVRLAVELIEQARIVCAHTKAPGGKRLKLTDYLDSINRPAITRDYQAVMDRLRRPEK